MKCRRCQATAVVALPSHNSAFCAPCFLDFFSRQVARGIETQRLMSKDDRVLVALSGGKDSLALMLELSRQGYDVTGLHIDLAIPGSSRAARTVVERFCQTHGFRLLVKDMAAEGLPIPRVKEVLKRPICSACGKIKRHFFNRIAREQGFTVLATGHNLDDEVARLTSNTLRWDRAYLSDQGPALEDGGGFARKVKPLWRLTEFETANYAFLMGIENHYAPCPYSAGASFSTLKGLWMDLEEAMPGRKMDFYQGFLERGRPAFRAVEEVKGESLRPCARCGCPTSAGVCGVCRIREALAEKQA
ncbi:MAG: TIGR00269 family protein [Desulfovibrionaceae bacterium]|nr:TIGR00269 family protein [Desulfovibrionaceae bacterium]